MAGAEAKENLLTLLSDAFIEEVEAGNKSVDARKSRGQTALMISIEFSRQPNGGLARISKLISLGADLWARDSNNEMAIHYACSYGSKSVLKIILDETKTKAWDEIDREQYINSRGGGQTPLHLACIQGKHKKIQMLIDAGVDIEARTGKEQMPAVYYSAQLGKLGVVKKFPLEMLSKFYSLGSDEYRNILFGAVAGNEIAVVDWLLWRKVPVKIPGRKSLQPIEMAIELSDLAIFKLLLKYTPYHQVMRKAQQWVFEGRIDVYEELMSYIKTRTMEVEHSVGLLAAAISVNYKYPYARRLADPATAEPPEMRTEKNTMAKDLIQMGAPLNFIIHHNSNNHLDSMHITLLTLACINKNTEVIECMLRAGADPNIGQKMRPLGQLLTLLIPNPPHAPWLEAWPLIQLCLDNSASPTAIYGPDYNGGRLQNTNLFTASIYASYLNYNKTFIKALIRDFIPRGLGFKVSWLNGHGNPSKLVSKLFKSRAIWKDAHYDEEEEIYVLTSPSKCPQGCQMWGCEHDEGPVRLNTESCKHIICAGHMRKLIEMNQKNNDERRREGGNQLPLTCPVCRESIKDIELMSQTQIEHWHAVESKINASLQAEQKQIEFQNENLKAIFKVFEPKISKRQQALKRVRARVKELEGEIAEIENNKAGLEKFHIQKKKEHQTRGLDERKQLRKKQLLDKCTLHF